VLGLSAKFTGVHLTEGDPTKLTYQPSELVVQLGTAIGRAIENDGAEAVIIGGGPLAAAARDLAPQFHVPIIEPIPAAVRRVGKLLERNEQAKPSPDAPSA
jgi:Asp/Glu/hydantoin racemase